MIHHDCYFSPPLCCLSLPRLHLSCDGALLLLSRSFLFIPRSLLGRPSPFATFGTRGGRVIRSSKCPKPVYASIVPRVAAIPNNRPGLSLVQRWRHMRHLRKDLVLVESFLSDQIHHILIERIKFVWSVGVLPVKQVRIDAIDITSQEWVRK